MPSQNQSADRSERERFPEVAEEIGEDPARWLDHDMLKQTLVRQEVDPNSEFGQMRLVEDNDKNSTFGKMFRARVRASGWRSNTNSTEGHDTSRLSNR